MQVGTRLAEYNILIRSASLSSFAYLRTSIMILLSKRSGLGTRARLNIIVPTYNVSIGQTLNELINNAFVPTSRVHRDDEVGWSSIELEYSRDYINIV